MEWATAPPGVRAVCVPGALPPSPLAQVLLAAGHSLHLHPDPFSPGSLPPPTLCPGSPSFFPACHYVFLGAQPLPGVKLPLCDGPFYSQVCSGASHPLQSPSPMSSLSAHCLSPTAPQPGPQTVPAADAGPYAGLVQFLLMGSISRAPASACPSACRSGGFSLCDVSHIQPCSL